MAHNILLAEDDPDIVEILRLYLTAEGHTVLSAADGEAALELLRRERVDLIIADLMMPKLNGYELIRAVRQENNVPILILSAKSMESDKVLGLNIGADAYLTKPFDPLEVTAYVNAALRRYYQLGAAGTDGEPAASSQAAKALTVGELTLDTERLEFTKNGERIFLTPAELKILMQLMRSPGRVYTRTQLYECVNGEYFENTDNTMTVHIANLRAKIEDDPAAPRYIITVRGLGYKIENIE